MANSYVSVASVADSHHFDADPDPDSACHFGADPIFRFDADPDPEPTFQFDADPCGFGSGSTRLSVAVFLVFYIQKF